MPPKRKRVTGMPKKGRTNEPVAKRLRRKRSKSPPPRPESPIYEFDDNGDLKSFTEVTAATKADPTDSKLWVVQGVYVSLNGRIGHVKGDQKDGKVSALFLDSDGQEESIFVSELQAHQPKVEELSMS